MDENMKKDYTKCYIAFLDILGFKNRINHSSCQEILDIYKDIKNPLKSIHIGDKNNSAQEIYTARQIKTKVMSDSICFYIDADLTDSLFCLLSCCAIFQAKLLSLQTPVLVRGAIVLGDLYAQNDVTFGPGLTQAYLLEEGGAKYPRIIITKETLSSSFCNISRRSFQTNIDELVLCDTDKYYYVNWQNFFFDSQLSNKNSDSAKCVVNFKAHVENVLDCTTDFSIREKYLYLDEKIRSYEQNLGDNHDQL